MSKIYINKLDNFYEQEVHVSGFVDNIRNLQYVIFLILRDSTGKVQITIEKDESNKDLINTIEKLTIESSIEVTGIVKQNEKVKMGGKEIIPSNIIINSLSLDELPINIHNKEAQFIDTRLDYRWLDLRNESNAYIFKIESEIIRVMRDYLYQHNFTEIHTPKLIGTASESGSEVFEVKYFDRKAYLAQSPQFYKQMAISAGFGNVFEVAPCFRAENSNTNRHTTEFTSFDVELSDIDSYEDVMSFEEDLLKESLTAIKEKYGDKIKELYNVDVKIPTHIPRVSLTELNKVFKDKYNYNVTTEDTYDLSTEGEHLAYQYALDSFDSEFIFVTGYPAQKRAFYHMRKDGTLEGFDLIWKGIELTSGAQREHRYEEIVKNAKEKGLDKDVEFYLEFFKYGCPPHGGFAFGVDRLIMILLNLPSLKEAMFIFRGPNRLNP